MCWDLWRKGGYFIHSTPHYGQLGVPAPMGCIRQSFLDAQALFKLVVDDDLSAMIRVQPVDSVAAASRLQEIRTSTKDMPWVLGQLQFNLENVEASINYYGSELNIYGGGASDLACVRQLRGVADRLFQRVGCR